MNIRQPYSALVLISMCAGLSMGNTSCKQTTNPTRLLKMEVEVGTLGAQKVTLPDGEIVDFPTVANLLFYRRVITNDHFVMINPVPSVSNIMTSSTSSGSLKAQSADVQITDPLVSKTDVQLLQNAGFLSQIKSSSVHAKGLSAKAVADDQIPACLYDMPQAVLGGDVISFSASWGAGAKIGYDSSGVLTGTAGGSVTFSQSKLDLGLRADDVLTQQNLVLGDAVTNQNNINLAVDFLGGLLGLNFFYQQPITDTISGGIDKGLGNIISHLVSMLSPVNKSWNDVWVSKVLYEPVEVVNGDTQVAIRGGYRAGVQIGDTFLISNTYYDWGGSMPCMGPLRSTIDAPTPIARATVIQVGDNLSIANVTYLNDGRVHPGDRVHIEKLFTTAAVK